MSTSVGNPLFATKPMGKLGDDASGTHEFKRTLGPVSLVALGIGAIIGAGIFSLTGIAAADNAGPAVVLSFLIAALGCGFAGLCYSELSGMIPAAGSAYSYAYASLGELVAWIIGWALVLEYAVGAATVSVSWSGYITSFLSSFGLALPHALTASPFDADALNHSTPGYREPAGDDDYRAGVAVADPRHLRIGEGERHDRGRESGRSAGRDRVRRFLR